MMIKKLTIFILFATLLCQYSRCDDVENQNLQWHISAGITPLLGVRTLIKDTELKEDDFHREIKNGYGVNLNFGIQLFEPLDAENMSIGWHFDYMGTLHDIREEDFQIRIDQFHFECSHQSILLESNYFKLKHLAAIGGGLLLYSTDDEEKKDFITGSGKVKYLIDFEFYQHYDLQVGGGLFLWGKPGETQAYGGFLQLSLNFHF